MKIIITELKSLWKESTILIALYFIFYKYYPNGDKSFLIKISFLPLVIGLLWGFIIKTINTTIQSIYIVPIFTVIISMILSSLPGIIHFITASDKEYLGIFTDPKWEGHNVLYFRMMSIGGAIFALCLFSGVSSLFTIIGSWVGIKSHQLFIKGKKPQTDYK